MARKRNVVLGFETKNLSLAEGLARSISAKVKQAKDLATDTAQVVRGRVRETLKEIRALKDGAIERDRLASSASALKGRGLEYFGEVSQRIGRIGGLSEGFNRLRGAAAGLRSAVLSEQLDTAADLAGMAGPQVRAAAVVAKAIVVPLLRAAEERLQKRLQLFALSTADTIERMRYEMDYGRRINEDPAFAYAEAKKAYRMAMAEDTAMSTGGWHESADFLEGFGG